MKALITLTTPVPVEATWSQGSISYASGVTITSSTRIRTNFIRVPIQLTVTVPSGMKYSIRCYSTNDSSGYIVSQSTDWLTGTISLNGEYYYRVVAAYADDSDILPSSGTNVSFEGRVATDTTLTEPNVAADAEITGIEINEAKQLANAALNLNKINILPVNKFYQGSITYDTGQNLDSSTRVRAAGYFQFPKSALVKVVVKSGYKVVGRVFSGNPASSSEASQVYVGYLPVGSLTLLEDGFNFIPNEDYFYRFVIAYADDSDITPSDVLGEDALTLIYYTPMETSVIPITTLLGNVCIRASKTYNFSDGTPPVIGWYLLQGTDNRFYKSTDLKSAKYLFTFSAPSSTVSNWSCGIDKDDNVVFIKDAAGYTDDDGPRLDDAKRVNPVCFLASEQYETSHEIDFGSSFKPAGWISNVGWCLLSNGDVVFCEYTRGTLATCNVWHISGDITNPANWEKTWSHAIVDSIAPDVSEMKHCHCVMYDFFTGIVYFGTGDGTSSSYIYHSTDNGATWTITYGPNRDRCRLGNIVFTKDYAYWASDSYEQADKHFFIATRDANGVIDVANATSIQIPAGNSQACYGCVFVRGLNLIVMMDRADNRTSNPLTLRGYDLTTGTIVTLATIPVVGTGHVGFRTKYIEWYPTENCVPIGFNPRTGGSTGDTNENAVCGNLGGTTGDGSTRINNLLMYLYKPDGENFDIRFGTVPLK